eukprot:m51a1_g13820 putative adenylate guanylate cyclase (312) ;mRNA; r:424914-431003
MYVPEIGHVPVVSASVADLPAGRRVEESADGYSSATELRTLESRQALEEAALLYGVLNSQLSSLNGQVTDFSNWNYVYFYLAAKDPHGPFWALLTHGYSFLELMDLEGAMFIMPNGTMLNGFMWGANRTFGAPKKGMLPNESFAETSILFCDISGFRDWAVASAPEVVTGFLSAFIERLDGVAERHGITKIKTILDIYTKHSHSMLRMAQEFHRVSQDQELPDSCGKHVGLRVGVSTGPCAGGIIGKRNWVYDLWSDTVNMAARLKAKAQVGTVLCDVKTWECTRDEFRYRDPLSVEIKGKGLQTVYELAA